MPLFSCLADLLRYHAECCPQQAALAGAHQPPMTYASLFSQTRSVVSHLHALGLGRGDRIAVVLPNGPEMAAAFLGIAVGATCAPLNPAYRASEFEYYLSDLGAKALIVQAGAETPAAAAAQAQGIPILRLLPVPDGCAGSFVLQAEGASLASAGTNPTWSGPDDAALVLHTSGTTARPKIVPLTQANLCTSAQNIARCLNLTSEDLCLNVMPLFHIHGLVGALLASLTAGAEIECSPGFSAPDFFPWLARVRPTWYTAVPTMHQAILARAAQQGLIPEDLRREGRLRLVRSSSAALPPPVMAGLETLFSVPVLEAYGMTEAAHQMASSPLPPRPRKPGSVGLAAGPDMAIMDAAGRLCPQEIVGEVVIRGASVMSGYGGDFDINAAAWIDGWFRTGDQGYFDGDGYLFLTGRLKELINRGGEKISPREIDEALLEHPAVAQAVTFAAPHPRLGEEIMAAVVLRPEQAGDGGKKWERELREFVAARLSDFKVPSRILLLDEIPKGPTGKVQRIGLAQVLGVSSSADSEPMPAREEASGPQTLLEARVIALCREVLLREEISRHDNFFQIGGDSLLAARLLARLEHAQAVSLSLVRLFETPTPAGLAQAVEEAQAEQEEAELAGLLAEMELLSDEEAEQLLQE